MERLGLSWGEVHRRNPRAVYALVSGYGDVGPERDRPSYDVIVQGECGLMDLTGQPDEPPTKAGISVADLVAGTNCVEGVLAALLARGRTGLGQKVDVALLDGMPQLLTYQGQGYFATGRSPVRMGNAHPSIVPYETFKTSDGYINLGVGSESLWMAFCERMHLAELWEDPRFARNADRVAHRTELRASEGAGVLVFEELGHALRRDARVYAEVLGFGMTDDSHHITAPEETGEDAASAMRLALQDGGVAPDEVDYINAHGTSTPYNDATETRAIKQVFGDHARRLAVSSTKSQMGHLLGASGGAELVAVCLAMRHGLVPPTSPSSRARTP